MCGICGVWNYQTNELVDRDLVQRMTSTLAHRGPDDSGVYFEDTCGVGLGFRRLSIIDLSHAGCQPMSNEDGSVWIVFNGEIYNFLSLRTELKARAHTFRSSTDTETVIHEYEELGTDCLRNLNGMFAFAIWDANRQRLLMACDRVGKKPLYYLDDGQRLVFASELKAILADHSIPREVDYTALSEYLALGYVPAPRTIFRDIHKLPPGHIMVLEKGKAVTRRYWDWLPAFSADFARSEEEWIEMLQALLQTVVSERLISDVPMGVLLSGGVDSSAVVAAMAELGHRPIRTFSIGFEDEECSELPYARLIAQRFGTEHHEETVQPGHVRELLPRLVLQFDEPFADYSALPTYFVSKMARQHVTVALSGDGGDEALAGYNRYAQMMCETGFDKMSLTLRQALMAIPAKLLPSGRPGRRFAQRMRVSFNQRYAFCMRGLSEEQICALIRRDVAVHLERDGNSCISAAMQNAGALDQVSRMQYADSVTYLPGDILVKVDRMSMANSLEIRSPFLDYRFLELVATIPSQLRLRGNRGKYIFRKAMRAWLPDEILERPKMGFGFPLRDWFRDSLAGYAMDVFTDPVVKTHGLIDPKSATRLVRMHQSGKWDLGVPLWTLLVLEVWRQNYLG